jgi:hypothetical protein
MTAHENNEVNYLKILLAVLSNISFYIQRKDYSSSE